MTDAINEFAIQFAAANRDEQRSLRAELNALRHLLAAVVVQSGGELVVGDRYRFIARPDEPLEFLDDTWNRCLRIRRPTQAESPKPAAAETNFPDWML